MKEESGAALQQAMESGTTVEINTRTEELRKMIQEAGASVYQQAAEQQAQQQDQADSAQQAPHQGDNQGPKTVDAEYKVVDEENKKEVP